MYIFYLTLYYKQIFTLNATLAQCLRFYAVITEGGSDGGFFSELLHSQRNLLRLFFSDFILYNWSVLTSLSSPLVPCCSSLCWMTETTASTAASMISSVCPEKVLTAAMVVRLVPPYGSAGFINSERPVRSQFCGVWCSEVGESLENKRSGC